jgi:hypothetical protein
MSGSVRSAKNKSLIIWEMQPGFGIWCRVCTAVRGCSLERSPYRLVTDGVNFESCGCSLTLAEIYGGVEATTVS